MSTTERPDYLTDPARAPFRAAQNLAMDAGPPWITLDAMPEGEVIWREDNDSVTLTPDGWLVYVNRGKAEIYSRKLRATPERIAALRGQPAPQPAPPTSPARSKPAGCTCPAQIEGGPWIASGDCPLHGYGS